MRSFLQCRPTPCCSPSPSSLPDSCWAPFSRTNASPRARSTSSTSWARPWAPSSSCPFFRYVNVESHDRRLLAPPGGGRCSSCRPKTWPSGCSASSPAPPPGRPLQRNEIFAIYYPDGSMLAATRDPPPGPCWNTRNGTPWRASRSPRFGAAARPRGSTPPSSVKTATFLRRYRKLITQNNFAFTYGVDYDGRPGIAGGHRGDDLRIGLLCDVGRRSPRSRSIGVGGGFDILTALVSTPREVTGIEINAATLNILRNV